MKPTHLLGIDVGTQGTKAVLFDRQGRALAAAFRKSRLHQPAPGMVEEDPEFQVKTVCRCIKACLGDAGVDPRTVAGVGIDGQMAGILGVGDDGRHVTPYDSWLDTRCSGYITRMHERAGEEVIRKTGGPASFNHGPKILWWKHERPEVYDRIAKFVQPGGYAAMRLCGMDASQAFIDKSAIWNQIKADALGIPVVEIDRHEGAPLGAAILAGYGVGLFGALESAAARWIHKGKTVRPARKLAPHYRARLARYEQLLEHLSQWADSESEIP